MTSDPDHSKKPAIGQTRADGSGLVYPQQQAQKRQEDTMSDLEETFPKTSELFRVLWHQYKQGELDDDRKGLLSELAELGRLCHQETVVLSESCQRIADPGPLIPQWKLGAPPDVCPGCGRKL